MTSRRYRRLALSAATLLFLSFLATGGITAQAAPITPIGAGQWGPSPNVGASPSCARLTTPGGTCTVSANSEFTLIRPTETCVNATYVVSSPVIVGANTGCNSRFSATVSATGTGVSQDVGQDPPAVSIEVGACAGFTISNATATVTDDAVGTFSVPVRVVVTPKGWEYNGNYVSLNIGGTSATVLAVSGRITPACTAVRRNNTTTGIYFKGQFSGNYALL